MAQERHKLILWTVREGELLEEAIEWCRQRGVFFYSVNKDYPEEEKSHNGFSRNLGGLPDWGTIYQMIHEQKPYEPVLCDRQKPTGDLSWIEKLLGKRNK